MSRVSPVDIVELIQMVRASQKYGAIDEDLIRGIGLRELAARGTLKEAVKATKNKLHQVAGAYLDARPPYDEWLSALVEADDGGRTTEDDREPRAENREPTDDGGRTTGDRPLGDEHSKLKTQNSKLALVCREIMRHHASTRERLPFLGSFYATALAGIGPIRSVLDVACGLNPLALPWMPFGADVAYDACDIYADMVDFLNGFFRIAGVRGQAQVCDLISNPPRQPVDLALVLKVFPPLDQLKKDAGRDLLRALDAPYLLVSFPARSLGGRDKGMASSYEARFRALAEAEGWAIERFIFPTELAFLVRRE